MWKKKHFVDEIQRRLAYINTLRAASPEPEPGVSVTYPDERELRAAIDWFKGKEVRMDFKIESRMANGRWFHTLMYGSMGYSAANPLVTIKD